MVAPVAEAYSTRAFGSACCRRSPASPCCDGFASPRCFVADPAAFAIACASSKTITPSKAWRDASSMPPASHATIWSSRAGASPRAGERSVA